MAYEKHIRSEGSEATWSPPVEVFEKQDHFFLRMEVPGVSSEDLDISVTGDVVRVSGNRRPPEDIKHEECEVCETAYGPFYRAISLPSSVDPGKVKAELKDGMLYIGLPKATERKPTKVEVKPGATS